MNITPPGFMKENKQTHRRRFFLYELFELAKFMGKNGAL
jgi:hypothetical protein